MTTIDEDGNELPKLQDASADMLVTADYAHAEDRIVFLDWDGNEVGYIDADVFDASWKRELDRIAAQWGGKGFLRSGPHRMMVDPGYPSEGTWPALQTYVLGHTVSMMTGERSGPAAGAGGELIGSWRKKPRYPFGYQPRKQILSWKGKCISLKQGYKRDKARKAARQARKATRRHTR